MLRALTALTFIPLLLSAWDCFAPAQLNVDSWSRLRSRHCAALDVGWDRFYSEVAPLVPDGQPIGLVQVAPEGTPTRERQYYFLQYALTPRLVIPGSDQEFVVVYGPAAAASSLIDVRKFAPVRTFEDEFALYRRRP